MNCRAVDHGALPPMPLGGRRRLPGLPRPAKGAVQDAGPARAASATTPAGLFDRPAADLDPADDIGDEGRPRFIPPEPIVTTAPGRDWAAQALAIAKRHARRRSTGPRPAVPVRRTATAPRRRLD